MDVQGAVRGVITSSDYATEDVGIPFSIIRAPQLFGQWLPPGGIEEIYRTARLTPVCKLMRTPPITCGEDASLDDVVRTLVERKVHHVIVVRDRKPVGVISRHDLLRAMLRAAERAA